MPNGRLDRPEAFCGQSPYICRMSQSLKTIADQLVQQAVEVSEREAQKKLLAAQEEAEEIRRRASEEARRILVNANEQALRIGEEGMRDLQRAARLMKDRLEQEIRSLIATKAVVVPLEHILTDRLHGIILELMRSAYRNQDGRIEIRLSERAAKAVVDGLEASVHSVLGIETEILSDQEEFAGFYIQREQDRYRVSFTAESFHNALLPFLSPLLQQLFVPTYEE